MYGRADIKPSDVVVRRANSIEKWTDKLSQNDVGARVILMTIR